MVNGERDSFPELLQTNAGRKAGVSATGRFAAVVALSLLLMAVPVYAAEWTFGEEGCRYDTLQEAIDAAEPGDTILVGSGIHRESLILDKRLTLKGVDTGAGIPQLIAVSGHPAVSVTGDGVTIEGFAITGGSNTGILITSSDNAVLYCRIHDSDRGIRFSSSNGAVTGTRVTGNSILDNSVGISLDRNAEENLFYANSLANTLNAFALSGGNHWSSEPLAYRFEGREYTSGLGNSWDDFEGTDSDGDGIGDEAYLPGSRGRGTMAGIAGQNQVMDAAPLIRSPEYYVPGASPPTTAPPTVTSTPTITPVPADAGGTPEPASTTVPEAQQDGGKGPAMRTTTQASDIPYPDLPASVIFLAGLLIAGLILGRVVRKERGRPPGDRSALSRAAAGILFAVYAASGVLFAFFAYEQAVVIESAEIVGLPLLAAGAIGLILSYLALSSFALGYGILSRRALTGLHRLHPFIAAMAALAVAAVLWIRPGALASGLRGVLLLTLLLATIVSVLHSRRIQGTGDTHGEGAAIGREGGAIETVIGEEIAVTARFALNEAYFPSDLREKYADVAYIGKGGTARVFRAVRRSDGATVAVKVPISFDEVTGKMFMKEMRIWEELHHRNIVDLLSVNILPSPYVEMEYIGRSLAGIEKPVAPPRAAAIMRGVAEGMAYAHAHGVIHRDLKPHNILLTEGDVPKITDWGLGKIMGDSRETSIIGFSLTYAAPEQIAPKIFGHPDQRTDIYQLGVVFYELVTGTPPFSGESLGEFSSAILEESPLPPSAHLPGLEALDGVILKCLAKDPAERYQSVEEFIGDLDAAAGHGEETAET